MFNPGSSNFFSVSTGGISETADGLSVTRNSNALEPVPRSFHVKSPTTSEGERELFQPSFVPLAQIKRERMLEVRACRA